MSATDLLYLRERERERERERDRERKKAKNEREIKISSIVNQKKKNEEIGKCSLWK